MVYVCEQEELKTLEAANGNKAYEHAVAIVASLLSCQPIASKAAAVNRSTASVKAPSRPQGVVAIHVSYKYSIMHVTKADVR